MAAMENINTGICALCEEEKDAAELIFVPAPPLIEAGFYCRECRTKIQPQEENIQ